MKGEGQEDFNSDGDKTFGRNSSATNFWCFQDEIKHFLNENLFLWKLEIYPSKKFSR